MKLFTILLGVTFANLRGLRNEPDTPRNFIDILFLQDTNDDKIHVIKAQTNMIIADIQTFFKDFQNSCKDFLEIQQKEEDDLKQIIEKSEFVIRLLPELEEIELKLKANQEKINEFIKKMAENDQSDINNELQIEPLNERKKNDIEELNQAIDYLIELVKADKGHIEEILSQIISIKVKAELETDKFSKENLYESVLQDLQSKKIDFESKITKIQQERHRIENYIKLINPQLSSVSSLIASNSLLCDAHSSLKSPLYTLATSY